MKPISKLPGVHVRRDVNIRASALHEFWGTRFKDDLYLWEGAKHLSPQSLFQKDPVPVLPDSLVSPCQVTKAYDYCADKHIKLLPKVAQCLNSIHEFEFPVSFWRTVLGEWLFRYLSVIYDKFYTFRQFDPMRIDVKLLSRDSFYIPYYHDDWLNCFCHDFGIQQLLTVYFELFSECVNLKYMAYAVDLSPSEYRQTDLNRRPVVIHGKVHNADPEIGLLQFGASTDEIWSCAARSAGRIMPIQLPLESPLSPAEAVDIEKRAMFESMQIDDSFDSYVNHSLVHCLPMRLVEHFRSYFEACATRIAGMRFSHLVAEYCTCDISSAIFAAAAQLQERKLVLLQHGASDELHQHSLNWIDVALSDHYVTTGWSASDDKVVAGGFRDVPSYRCSEDKTDIVFISHVRAIYMVQLGTVTTNSNYRKSMDELRKFLVGLSPRLRRRFVFRPRMAVHFWEKQKYLDIDELGIRIDTKHDFVASINNAGLVIIDHLSTGVAELLLSGVPFVIYHDAEKEPLNAKGVRLISILEEAGLVYHCYESLNAFLEERLTSIHSWWRQDHIQKALRAYANSHVRGFEQRFQCLKSFLNNPESVEDEPCPLLDNLTLAALKTRLKQWGEKFLPTCTLVSPQNHWLFNAFPAEMSALKSCDWTERDKSSAFSIQPIVNEIGHEPDCVILSSRKSDLGRFHECKHRLPPERICFLFDENPLHTLRKKLRSWVTLGSHTLLYGAGKHTDWLLTYFMDGLLELEVRSIIDDKPKIPSLHGLPVIATDAHIFTNDCQVIVSSDFHQELMRERLRRFLPDKQILCLYSDVELLDVEL